MEYTETTKAPSNVHEMPSQSEEMRGLRAAMDEYMAAATEKAREAAAYADRRVQQSPWTAVGVGFGLGMMCGALVAIAARASAR